MGISSFISFSIIYLHQIYQLTKLRVSLVHSESSCPSTWTGLLLHCSSSVLSLSILSLVVRRLQLLFNLHRFPALSLNFTLTASLTDVLTPELLCFWEMFRKTRSPVCKGEAASVSCRETRRRRLMVWWTQRWWKSHWAAPSQLSAGDQERSWSWSSCLTEWTHTHTDIVHTPSQTQWRVHQHRSISHFKEKSVFVNLGTVNRASTNKLSTSESVH